MPVPAAEHPAAEDPAMTTLARQECEMYGHAPSYVIRAKETLAAFKKVDDETSDNPPAASSEGRVTSVTNLSTTALFIFTYRPVCTGARAQTQRPCADTHTHIHVCIENAHVHYSRFASFHVDIPRTYVVQETMASGRREPGRKLCIRFKYKYAAGGLLRADETCCFAGSYTQLNRNRR
ncbi:hypothetical protein EVAR_23614_1 [Eumeta japonica]|uniref:Uncharacterized protein n=1 Tax=Eumeta variegata TaxID=151549 RepID=A0A4C1X1D7_EUMVA|nr:hypothetical protein EVAR_23614_1 [Eumeta japonica]